MVTCIHVCGRRNVERGAWSRSVRLGISSADTEAVIRPSTQDQTERRSAAERLRDQGRHWNVPKSPDVSPSVGRTQSHILRIMLLWSHQSRRTRYIDFYAPQLYRQVLLRRVLAMGILSVCLSVRHGPVQKQPSDTETPGLHHMIA